MTTTARVGGGQRVLAWLIEEAGKHEAVFLHGDDGGPPLAVVIGLREREDDSLASLLQSLNHDHLTPEMIGNVVYDR